MSPPLDVLLEQGTLLTHMCIQIPHKSQITVKKCVYNLGTGHHLLHVVWVLLIFLINSNGVRIIFLIKAERGGLFIFLQMKTKISPEAINMV